MHTRRPLLGVIANAYLLNVAGRLAEVVWILLLFTTLSVTDIALFAFASAVAAFFSILLDAGLNQTLLREFSSERLTLGHGARTALAVRLVLLLMLGLVALLWFMLEAPTARVQQAVLLACAVQLWILIEQFCQQWLKANDRQTLANSLAAIEPFFKLAALAALVLTADSVTVSEVFATQIAYHSLLAVGAIWFCMRTGERSSSNRLRVSSTRSEILRSSAWFACMGLITVAQNRLDWLMVASLADEATTANYSLANRAYEVLMMLIGTGTMTLFPLLCRDRSRPDQSDALLLTFKKTVLALGVLASGLAAILLPPICQWIWNDKYAGANVTIAMLMPIASLSVVIQLLYYDAVAARAEARLVRLGLVSTLVQLLVNVALIPSLGVFGAVLGMLALALSNLALYFWQHAALGLQGKKTFYLLTCYAGAMAVVWLGIALSRWDAWLQLCIGIAGWSVVTYRFLMSDQERAMARHGISTARLAFTFSGPLK